MSSHPYNNKERSNSQRNNYFRPNRNNNMNNNNHRRENRNGWGRHSNNERRCNNDHEHFQRKNDHAFPYFSGNSDTINDHLQKNDTNHLTRDSNNNSNNGCDRKRDDERRFNDRKRSVPQKENSHDALASDKTSRNCQQSNGCNASKRPCIDVDVEQLRRDIKRQRGNVFHLSEEVFVRPKGWNEKLEKAKKKAKDAVIHEKKNHKKNNYESDSDGSNSEESYIGDKPISGALNYMEKTFIDALPHCHLMMIGFHVDHNIREHTKKICCCPCSNQNKVWRDLYKIKLDDGDICNNNIFAPAGLMDHLKKKGGVYSEEKQIVPMANVYHYAARAFLIELYSDYHGNIGHEALYCMGDKNYMNAQSAATRKDQREKQSLETKNTQLENQVGHLELKVFDLEKISKDLFDKCERLKSESRKLGVVEKERKELSQRELEGYQKIIRGHFDLLRYLVEKGNADQIKICVEPDPTGKSSFLLQPFLDNLWDSNIDSSAFSTKAEFEKCREVMFGDIMSEREAKKDKKKQSKLVIAHALTIEWNVIYSKNEQLSRGQMKLDTAVDEGGPSRQFHSDVFLQMQTLAVPVGKSGIKVPIFEQGTAGDKRGNVLEIIPIHDDELRRRIQVVLLKDEKYSSPEVEDLIDRSIIRIEKYARAMGRIMLHSFICDHPVSSLIMTPFYMNLLLRGIMPGDARYEQSDILKHIDGILCTQPNTLLSYWLEDGELDKTGQPFTRDTIFSERIPNEFIKTRSIVLGGLMDGLSLRGIENASRNLQEGSELSNILQTVPLDAISKILFARPNLSFEDVQEALSPVFSDGEEEGLDKNEEYIHMQRVFYETQFLPYIKDEAERDCKFLSRFVECATGSCCLPYVAAGGSPVQIKVEFNLGVDALSYPSFHTCTKEIVLPGHVYVRGADDFRELMNDAIMQCGKQFDMQ